MLPRVAKLLLGLPLVASCGGKVVVDLPTGGTGSGTGGAGGATSTGSGASCDALLQDLAAKILAARVCAPNANIVQCDGTAVVLDGCGCHIVLDEQNTQAVSAAAAAATAVAAAGCTGVCDAPCPPWSGAFNTAACLPDQAGSTGHCVQIAGD